jgi:hypothetical protein
MQNMKILIAGNKYRIPIIIWKYFANSPNIISSHYEAKMNKIKITIEIFA